MNLSTHFTLQEMTFSEWAVRNGIDNTPDPKQTYNLLRLCEILERARMALGRPVVVSSGYRNPAVNAAVGGSKNSAHMDGRAADVRIVGMPPSVFTRWLIHLCEAEKLPVDQVIDEYGRWTHIAVASAGKPPRREYLVAQRTPTGVTYSPLQWQDDA